MKTLDASHAPSRSGTAITAERSLPEPPRFRPLTKLEHILVPLDFSDNSLVALRYAMNFAKQFRARLTLVHVLDTLPLPYDYGFYDSFSQEKVAAAESRLRELVAKFGSGSADNSIATVVRSGPPGAELCRAVWDLHADMVILSTHGYSGLKNVLFGGITTEMIRHAPCPILVVRNDEEVPSAVAGTGVRQFLVPLGFSARSEAALSCAVKLAENCRGEVFLLHVVEPSALDEEISTLGAHFETYSAAANNRLLSVQARAVPADVRGTIAVRCGVPYAQIIGEAQRLSADLLVITTHGRTGMEHLLVGSTAERLMKHAPCPVLIVREPAR